MDEQNERYWELRKLAERRSLQSNEGALAILAQAVLHLEQSPVLPPHRHSYREGRDATGLPIPEEPAEMLQSGPTLSESSSASPEETTKPSREQEIAEETRSISVAINSLHRLGVPSAELEDQILPALLNKIYGHMSSTQPADHTTGRSASIDESADAPSPFGSSKDEREAFHDLKKRVQQTTRSEMERMERWARTWLQHPYAGGGQTCEECDESTSHYYHSSIHARQGGKGE